MHVVCSGHINWDVRLRVDRLPAPDDEARVRERSESGGGSAANVAAGLAALEVDARMFGSVGDDERGRRALTGLEAAGVESQVKVVDQETTTKYILIDDDGEIALLGTDGANEAVEPDDVSPSLLVDADGVHLTSQRPETARRIAELATARGIPVSFDPGRRISDRDYSNIFELTDLLFVNEREAEIFEGEVPWQVTKHGADGATVSGPDGTVSHPGFTIDDVVDTTGAGDAFAAGFLAVWLDGGDAEAALSVANACGGIGAATHGSKPDLSWERIEALGEGQ